MTTARPILGSHKDDIGKYAKVTKVYAVVHENSKPLHNPCHSDVCLLIYSIHMAGNLDLCVSIIASNDFLKICCHICLELSKFLEYFVPAEKMSFHLIGGAKIHYCLLCMCDKL